MRAWYRRWRSPIHRIGDAWMWCFWVVLAINIALTAGDWGAAAWGLALTVWFWAGVVGAPGWWRGLRAAWRESILMRDFSLSPDDAAMFRRYEDRYGGDWDEEPETTHEPW